MSSIIIALIILGVLVTVHEGGHFIAARLCGIRVEKFSVGFGKPIFKFVKNGVEYSLSWIPLGGYVKMKGDNPNDETSDPDTFFNASWWKRIIVAFAGPFTNLIFGLLVIITSFFFSQQSYDHEAIVDKVSGNLAKYIQSGDEIIKVNSKEVKGWYSTLGEIKDGEDNKIVVLRNGENISLDIPDVSLKDWLNSENIRPVISAVVGEIIPNTPAYQADLKEGDEIIKVGDKKVNNWYEMTEEIQNSSDSVNLTILRDDKEIQKELTKQEVPDSDRKIIGVLQKLPLLSQEKYSPKEAIVYGTNYTFGIVAMNYKGIYSLIKKPSSIKGSIGGPVMMFTTGKKYAEQGIAKGLQFVGLLNIVLMVMNLLPIPVLDGGHILFSFIEGIRGKRLTTKTQMALQQVGLFFLLALMMYAFYSDFSGIISRYNSN